MKSAIWVQILVKSVHISLGTYAPWKGIDPSFFFPAMGGLLYKLGSLALVWQPVWEKNKSELKRFKKLTLSHILLLAEGLS